MKLDEIKSIVELMTENGLSEFELEEEGSKILIKKGVPTVIQAAAPAPVVEMATRVERVSAAKPVEDDEDSDLEVIKAPFVGTFYRSSSPDVDPYVTVGSEVDPDKVVCIIEAMKVMNELKAEVRGVIKAILVENMQAVQYGQPLFKVEKI